MSRSTFITCEGCKERLWIGQGHIIYTGEPHTMDALQSFLYKHETGSDKIHNLQFKDDNADDDWYSGGEWQVWLPLGLEDSV